MKKLLFAIATLALCLNGWAQTYYPLPDSNTVWSVGNLKYLVKGDTVYNSITYQKYYYTVDTSLAVSSLQYVGMIRQDVANKRVYGIDRWISPAMEGLIYDFNLQINDTISVHPIDAMCSNKITLKVTGKDSLLINDGSYRQRLFFAGYYYPFATDTAIEGIGSYAGPLSSGLGPSYCGADMGCPILLCQKQNGALKYQNPLYPSCYLACGAGIKQVTTSNAVSIYPNPASQLVNLKMSQFDNANIEIYNTIGECVHRQMITSPSPPSNGETYTIDVSDLAEGVYQFIIMNSEFTINKRVVIVR